MNKIEHRILLRIALLYHIVLYLIVLYQTERFLQICLDQSICSVEESFECCEIQSDPFICRVTQFVRYKDARTHKCTGSFVHSAEFLLFAAQFQSFVENLNSNSYVLYVAVPFSPLRFLATLAANSSIHFTSCTNLTQRNLNLAVGWQEECHHLPRRHLHRLEIPECPLHSHRLLLRRHR